MTTADCGLEGSQVGTTSTTATGGSFVCTFPDGPGSSDVSVQVRDSDLAYSNFASQTVVIGSVAPSGTFTAESPVEEGSPATLESAAVTDPSPTDTTAGFHYSYRCDGNLLLLNGDYATASPSPTFDCTYPDNGVYSVVASVIDEDNASTTTGATITVTNVDPTATFNAPTTVNEGSNINLSLTAVVDPGTADTHEFRFSCDDGDTWSAWSTTNTLACSTDDNGTRDVKGEVRDDDGGSNTYCAAVTVTQRRPDGHAAGSRDGRRGRHQQLHLQLD